jgi:hypothetical protein
MRLKIVGTVEEVTLSHNGPTESNMEGLIYTREAAHAMLDTVLDSIKFPKDKE